MYLLSVDIYIYIYFLGTLGICVCHATILHGNIILAQDMSQLASFGALMRFGSDRSSPAPGIGYYGPHEIPTSLIEFGCPFNDIIKTYAKCLDDKEANIAIQKIEHSNVILPTVSLICEFAGVTYEDQYHLLSGCNTFVGDDRGPVLEKLMYMHFRNHVCDREAWSGPLCMNSEIHRAASYVFFTNVSQVPISTLKQMQTIIGVTQ